MTKLLSCIKLMRPHQWIKNGFVFTGLLFGHAWTDSSLLINVLLVAAGFSLLSSSVYIINDVMDREVDRQHPKKKNRPIASGVVGVNEALFLGISLMLLSLFAVWQLVGNAAVLILLAYLIMNIAYSFGLKHVVILDVFIIAAGFMLRILAGTIGVEIEPSSWLLLTGMMVTLFLGFTKRRAEMDQQEGSKRKVLEHYDERMLDIMIAVTSAAVVMSYSLYTVSAETIARHGTSALIYTSPLILYGMFRYLYLLYIHKAGEDPAGELVRDKHILITILLWLASTVVILS